MVMCNSLCGVRVNIMGERSLVAFGRKAMDRIRDIYIYTVYMHTSILNAKNKFIV